MKKLTTKDLRAWSSQRADDAGRLATELLQRRAECRRYRKALATVMWNCKDYTRLESSERTLQRIVVIGQAAVVALAKPQPRKGR